MSPLALAMGFGGTVKNYILKHPSPQESPAGPRQGIISDFLEYQSLRRSRRSGGGPVGTFQKFVDDFGAAFPRTYEVQRAYHDSDHVRQKGISPHPKADKGSAPCHRHACDGSTSMGRALACPAKSTEIVFSHKTPAGFPDPLHVPSTSPVPPHEGSQMRITRTINPDMVDIFSPERTV